MINKDVVKKVEDSVKVDLTPEQYNEFVREYNEYLDEVELQSSREYSVVS